MISLKPDPLLPEHFKFDAIEKEDPWQFVVKSYQINVTSMEKDQMLNYAAGILITDNSGGATSEGGIVYRHAILEFYWTADKLPPSGLNGKLLHLNYSVAEYAGIMDLLKSSDELVCYFHPDQYGGIAQVKPVARPGQSAPPAN